LTPETEVDTICEPIHIQPGGSPPGVTLEMTMAQVNTEAAEYIGYELIVSNDGDFEVPPPYTLPTHLRLCVALVRRRGVVLGQRWYLQEHDGDDETSIDLVSPVEIEGSYEICHAFLRAHNYTCEDDHVGIYRKSSS
jgi:hypothetical protein